MAKGLDVDVATPESSIERWANTSRGVRTAEHGRRAIRDLPLAGLKEGQLDALQAAAEIGYGRGVAAVSKAAKIAPTTLYRWLRKDERFIRAWQALPALILRQARPGIYAALVKKAHAGDVPAIKLASELIRDYVPPAQRVEHSGEVTLASLLLQAHKAVEGQGRTLPTTELCDSPTQDTTPRVATPTPPIKHPPQPAPLSVLFNNNATPTLSMPTLLTSQIYPPKTGGSISAQVGTPKAPPTEDRESGTPEDSSVDAEFGAIESGP